MPEYAQFSVVQLPFSIRLYRFIDAQVLMVPCQYLGDSAAGVVKEDEVFQQIEKILFSADAPEHGLKRDTAGFLFFKAFPFMEKFVLAAQRPHLGLQTIGEDKESVVVK